MSDEMKVFSKVWKSGYFEGDPLDPVAPSSFGACGYLSCLHMIWRLLIKPYVNADTTVLEIGPGRGAWTKCFVEAGSRKIYAIDAAPAEHTCFWDYVGRRDSVEYIVADDFSLRGVPDGAIDYFFSFGTFCHIPPARCLEYIRNLGPKMKPGAHGFLMIADYDKYNRFVAEQDRFSVGRIYPDDAIPIRGPTRWMPKSKAADAEGRPGTWRHLGVVVAARGLEEASFDVLEHDVELIHRDPILHFRKRAEGARS